MTSQSTTVATHRLIVRQHRSMYIYLGVAVNIDCPTLTTPHGHVALEANRRRRSQQHRYTQTGREGSTQTASQHALQETERQIQSTGVSALEQETYLLSSPETHTHTHTHTHPSHQPTSTAPSQPAMWPCQMTYDTQHLRPIGGGALSNAHTHTEGEGAASTQTASQHALQETERDRSKALGCQLSRASKRLTCCPHQTHTHTPIPPIQQHRTKPASRVAVSDDI
eukprot:COSAG06_NODE_4051_length_4630_cov_10.994262_3_plen_225_part_00